MSEAGLPDDFVALLEAGLSPAEALDYWALEVQGVRATEWATVRGTSRQSVNKNKLSAARSLDA